MKAQDLVILLKIILQKSPNWKVTDLAHELYLSQSEVSKALERLSFSGLLDETKKVPAKKSLYDLIVNGIQYIFPVKLGALQKGIPTAHSFGPLKSKVISKNILVWPHPEGKVRGESIEPLYKNVTKAAIQDEELHKLLALIDSLRVGKVREKEIAKKELEKRILGAAKNN